MVPRRRPHPGVRRLSRGPETLRIERDESVREEYDFEVYLRCIEWCEEAGVETVDDLHGRVVGPDAYQELWIDRCKRVAGDD